MAKFKVLDLMVLLETEWDKEIPGRPRPIFRGICPSSGAVSPPVCPTSVCPQTTAAGICPSSAALCVRVSVVVESIECVQPDDLALLKKQLAEALEIVAQREFAVRDTVQRMDSAAATAISEALEKAR